ncbi:MAG TPA: hypothetical protein VFS67_08805 [Polyangiaceae bacterium]|jgi:hypothetical protein|nr:hypothetical protein [Polyangiaceae bacterium]
MPRYRFTPEDLQPLRALLGGVDLQPLADQVIPVKRFSAEPRVTEPVPVDLPVKVLGREHPDGVPLAKLAELVQKQVPGARSVLMRGGRLHVVYDRAPTDSARAELRRLAADKAVLEKLKALPERSEPAEPELRERLQRSDLSDSEWLATFRRVEAARLTQAAKEAPAPQPSPARKTEPPKSKKGRS